MLWNDCCDRDTKRAVYIMLHDNIDSIHKHINYGNGRGYHIQKPNLNHIREKKMESGIYSLS